MSREAAERKRKQHEWLVSEENSRQQEERRLLNKLLNIRNKKNSEEAHARRGETEEDCARRLEALQERSEALRQNLERRLQRERPIIVKFSTDVRDRVQYGKKLATAQRFDMISKMHKKLEMDKRHEAELWEQKLYREKDYKRAMLDEQLARELKHVEEKVAGIQDNLEKKLEKQKSLLAHRCRNLSSDMEGAFTREWHARPEVKISAKHSKKNANTSSATFLGSLLQDRAEGGKYDLPSLSRTHYNGEHLTGTKQDLAATQKYDFYALLERTRELKRKNKNRLSLPAMPLNNHGFRSSLTGRSGADVSLPSINSTHDLNQTAFF